MLQDFAIVVNSLLALRPAPKPLALATKGDFALTDRIDALVGWCVGADWAIHQHAKRAAYAANGRTCADRKARAAALRQAPKPQGLPRANPFLVRVYDEQGALVRTERLEAAPRDPGAVSVARMAFPKLATIERRPGHEDWTGLQPLPDWRPLPEALDPILAPDQDPMNLTELRNKELLEEMRRFEEHEADAPCPRCKRGPALCNCDFWGAEEPQDEYAGFQQDAADEAIRLEGELVEQEQRLADAARAGRAYAAEIAQLERRREPRGSQAERERLARIAQLAAGIGLAGRVQAECRTAMDAARDRLAALEYLEEMAA